MTFRPVCPRCGELCEPEATICDCGSPTGLVSGVMPRFYVTEIEGDLQARDSRSSAATGMSCHVLDRAYCSRIVASYRTEDLHSGTKGARTFGSATPWERRERVRGLARARAMELNAGVAP